MILLTMPVTWSGSWADDDDTDLGIPPPPTLQVTHEEPEVIPPLAERRSYVIATMETATLPCLPPPRAPVIPQIIVNPVKRTISPPRRTIMVAAPTKQQQHLRRKAAPIIEEPATAISVETKCSNGDCKQRGHLKFTERHVEAQPKEGLHRLPEGVYCQDCVTLAAPRCNNEGCTGKAIICRPDARWPFGLFCQPCINAHTAFMRSKE